MAPNRREPGARLENGVALPSGSRYLYPREPGVRRICFTLQVRPDRLDEYRERHAQVWPDMLQSLAETGWRDYSLFLRHDGLLVGYLVTDDFDGAQEALGRTEASRRWEASMADFFVDTRADDKQPLDEVFNLEDQLARLRTPDAGTLMGEAR
jgi:L-rhamnose mutarotase